MLRDYIKNPLQKIKNDNNQWQIERPYKEDLYEKYIMENLSKEEICDYFKITNRMLSRWLSEFNIKKSYKLQQECLIKKVNNIKYEKPLYLPNDKKYNVYKELGIDITKLTRDYIKYPLKINQKIDKNDLLYVYIENNLSKENSSLIFNTSISKIIMDLEYYQIKKDISKIVELRKNTCNKLYGGNGPASSKEVLEKMKQTCLEKYGVDNISKTDYFKEKYKKVMNDNYGVDNYFEIYDGSGRKAYANNHLTDEQYEILISKEKLQKIVEECKTMKDVAEIVGTTSEYLYYKCKEYGIEINFEKRFSSYEEDLRKIIKDEYICNKNIEGKELDIYIPSKKIGIEFNGNYWHGELNKPINWHKDKSLYFEEKGIFVYHIWEWEWNNKKEQIINQLNNILGYNKNKIYARKCIIKEVNVKDKNTFLELNHLQGKDRSTVNFGLYYNNELVSLMTFVKPKFNKHYEWELSRFCSLRGCNVIGGASKLFKYFIEKYNPKSIISYSDIAHTRGNLYNLLGFNFDGYVKPNYIWFKGRNIILKSSCRIKNLYKQYPEYIGKSESEIMHLLKAYKIYNAGLKRWIWIKKEE